MKTVRIDFLLCLSGLIHLGVFAAQMPSAAYLSLKNEKGDRLPLACSAAIVGPRMLLTAGHCFEPDRGLSVFADKAFFSTGDGWVAREALEQAVHPEFLSGNAFFKDIAWVKIASDIPDGTLIWPVDARPRYGDHRPVFTIGYAGLTLQWSIGVTVPPIERCIVDLSMSELFFDYLNLARFDPLPRPGDSGGPVFVLRNGQSVLSGLIQEKGALYTDDMAITITRIAPFMDWIESSSRQILSKVY